MGERPEAKRALYKAIELDNSYAEAFYNLAGLYAVDGELDQADEYLRKAVYFYQVQGKTREAQEFEYVFKEYFKLK